MPPKKKDAKEKANPVEKMKKALAEEMSKEYLVRYTEAMDREKLKKYYDASAVVGGAVSDLIEVDVKAGIKDSLVREQCKPYATEFTADSYL